MGTYIPASKASFNGKFHKLKSIDDKEPLRYVVDDRSDYLKYLHIPSPVWRLSVFTGKQGKVETVITDTTGSYRSYLAQAKEKAVAFESC